MESAEDSSWNPRYKRNVIVYLVVYGILGGVTGITNNELLSYLQIISPRIVAGITMCSSIVAFLTAASIMTVHWLGYRKLMLIAPPVTILSIVIMTASKSVVVVVGAYIVSQLFIGLYDILYPIMFASYVPKDKQTKLFTAVLIDNLACQSVVTLFAGNFVVWLFGKLAHLKYSLASYWSGYQSQMSANMLSHYTQAYRVVLWLAAAMMAIAFFISFLMKDQKSDYQSTASQESKQGLTLRTLKGLMTKPVLVFLTFIAIVHLGAMLVTPFIPIYLNNYLHIPRGMTANINTIQTVAMFIGYFGAPWLEKKFGTVVSIGLTTIVCAPLMITLGFGSALGTGSTLVVTVMIVYFLRSGIANAAMPIQNTLQMSIVDKDLRPAITALTQIVMAIVSFIDGLFTEFYLFRTMSGYATAYYIASGLYIVGSVILIIFLTKQYNRKNQVVDITKETVED